MKKGHLFCIDGVDGCGKTTAFDLIHDRMEEKYDERAVFFHMPGGTPLGMELRKLIKSTAFSPAQKAERLMFAADNIQTLHEIVLPGLESGRVMLADRWSFITDYAYGLARGLEQSVMRDLQQFAPFVQADVLFVFDCPFEEIVRRKEAMSKMPSHKDCRVEALGKEFLEKVHAFYRAATSDDENLFARRVALRCAREVIRVDSGAMSPSEISKFIMAEIEKRVQAEG